MSIQQLIGSNRRTGWLLAAVAFLLYANAIPNSWAIDDSLVIHNNVAVRQGMAGLPAIFRSDVQKSSTGQDVKAVAGGRYRPLTPALFAVFAQIAAEPMADAKGSRLRNLGADTVFPHLLHALNALLYGLLCAVLYHLLLLLLRGRSCAQFIAFSASLLFAVHPLHTEAVANVKGADEIVALLFALLATRFCVLASDDEKRRKLRLALSAGCLLLAMLAKENALTFVAVIPLALWFFRKAEARKLVFYGAVLLLPVGLYLALRTAAVGSLSLAPPDAVNMMNNPFLVLREGSEFAPLLPGSDVMVLQHPSLQSIVPMHFSERLATNFFTWLQYLKLFAVPHPLTYDYYPRHVAIHSFSEPVVWLSVLAHLGLLLWAVMNLCARRLAAFGILFYFITFSIVSNHVFPIGVNMAERFMFMPSVGLCIAVAAGLAAIRAQASFRMPATAVAAILAVLFSIRTVTRNRDWKDNLTLMQHDLQVSEHSAKIKSDYGEVVLERIGEHARQAAKTHAVPDNEAQKEDIELLKSALPLYKEALDVYPMYGLVWFNLARTNQQLGTTEMLSPNERFSYLQTAIAAYGLTDTYKPLQYLYYVDTCRSMCYATLGKLYGQGFSDLDKAIAYLTEARRFNARNSYASFLLGTSYDLKGNMDSAFLFTKAAYNAEPRNADYKANYEQLCRKMIAAGKTIDTTSLIAHP